LRLFSTSFEAGNKSRYPCAGAYQIENQTVMVEAASATREDEQSAPRDEGEEPERSWRRTAVFAAVVLAAPLPLFVLHLQSLWLFRPHYYFFPLLLAGIAWLLWLRWPRFSMETAAPWWSSGLLFGGLLVLATGVLFFSPSLAAVAAVLSIGGLIGRYAVPGQGRDWLPIWLAMWLVVPPPFRWDFELVAWLQSSSVQMASRLLDVAGVRHLPDGNVLVLPGQRMLADEAYAGVHSLPVLLTITALFVVAARRPLVWAAVLLAASVAWAWLVNVARVVTVVLLQAWHQVDLTSGPAQELIGIAAILLGLALLASTDRWLAFLLRPIAARAGELPLQATSKENPLNQAWNWLVGARLQLDSDLQAGASQPLDGGRRPGGAHRKGRRRRSTAPPSEQQAGLPRQKTRGRGDVAWLAVFGLCGVLQVACLVPCAFAAIEALRAGTEAGQAPGRDSNSRVLPRQLGSQSRFCYGALATAVHEQVSLPAELCGWTLDKQERIERQHNDQAGRFACQWWYRRDSLLCLVSVDYPVPRWHDPIRCYAGNGWQPTDRRLGADAISNAGEHGREASWVEVSLAKPTGERGWLRFGLFDAAGNFLPPSVGGGPDLLAALARSPLGSRLLGRSPGSATEAVYQLQAFFSSPGRLSAEEQAQVRRLLSGACSELLSAERSEDEEAKRKP
jgi:exosortase